jgi:solute carrier family 41
LAIARFSGIAVFQPIINGVGGNLAAVQASRISTSLHTKSHLGTLPKDDHGGRVCAAPWAIFVRGEHAVTARILLAMVVPGHALFTMAVHFLDAGHTSLTPQFLALYLTAAVMQVSLLLFTAHW